MTLFAMFAAHHIGLAAILFALAGSLSVVAGLNVATSGPTDGRVRSYTATAATQGKGLVAIQGADDAHVSVSAAANVANALGIIEETNINAGDAQNVVMAGECYAQIGAAVTAPAYLKSDASGRLVPATVAADNVIAQALSSGSNANDFIVVRIVKFIHP